MTAIPANGQEGRPIEILLVEDDDQDADLVLETLAPADPPSPEVLVRRATRLEDAFPLLPGADAVLLDLMLPDSRGLETLKRLRERSGDTPVVVLSGLDDESVALDAVRNGAQDYVPKGPMGLRMLLRVVRHAMERNFAERQAARLRSLETEVVERRQAEERLRLSERRLAEAQRIAHVGSWEWDIPGNRVSWSDETFRIFGTNANAFDGTYEAMLNCLHPGDRAAMHEAIARAYETHGPYDLVHRVRRPDGSLRYVHARGETIVGDAGAVLRMVGTVQDITDVTLATAAAREQNDFISLLHRVSTAANLAGDAGPLLADFLPEIRAAARAAEILTQIGPQVGPPIDRKKPEAQGAPAAGAASTPVASR